MQRLQRLSAEILNASYSGDTAALVTDTLSRPTLPKPGKGEGGSGEGGAAALAQLDRKAAWAAKQSANTVKLWERTHKPEPLAQRFVQSGVCLPPDVATRLRRALKLPGGAARGVGCGAGDVGGQSG